MTIFMEPKVSVLLANVKLVLSICENPSFIFQPVFRISFAETK